MPTIEERIYEANRARDVLENEVFQQVFADIEKEVIEQWKTSPARDEAGREKLWIYLSMLNKVKKHLESSLESGKLANLELDHKRTLAERAKAFLS
jgi:hypothetical protein